MTLREVEVVPSPAGTLAAVASGGYTINSAVADLIDNAISAGATQVEVNLDTAGQGLLTIADDGRGMDEQTLISAMQIAAQHGQTRRTDDLGRYGTGMKAASLHLSRTGRFSVRSAPAGQPGTTVTLDTRRMAETGRWLIGVGADLPLPPGTTVEVFAPSLAEDAAQASAGLQAVAAHLRCTFADHIERGLKIQVQGKELTPWPLCSPELPEVSSLSPFTLDRGRVRITAVILPTHREDPLIEGPLGRREHAGFHVHRSGRALTLGGWMGIGTARRQGVARDRIRLLVELTPALDEQWQVNLAKSGCTIPRTLQPQMRDLVERVLERAGRQRRSRRAAVTRPGRTDSIWKVTGGIRRDHPLVTQVLTCQDGREAAVEQLLRHLEETRHD